ncbi:glycosyltransferase [Cryobacterium sp. TMT2-17-1]|uniref:glycosyltransferase family 4 protein n=1 Tax=Cryobacterium sp. TMT2-17-1 TaxID=1259248 RepID=UPI0010699EDE|nr:glycosyltransferase [Cryobacterium sp. TMT2-17-1]TFC47446.1 glycosyltransferase [Cryobacterium sp. TMT2-17-1]
MQKSYDLVFWQNTPSLHQAPLMRALTSGLGKRVLVVAAGDVSAARLAMGWEGIDYGPADLVIKPSSSQIEALVENNRGATAHIFSGVSSYPGMRRAMNALTRGGHRHIAIITEPWDPRGLAGKLRALKFAFRGKSWHHVDTLFACGVLARKQFASLGCELEKIAPFGYFVDPPARSDNGPRVGKPSIMFIGTLTERKDPRTLIQALALTPPESWDLTMVGDGPLRKVMLDDVLELNLSHRVSFVHRMANNKVRDALAACDLLVLPSQYDGWGAVVSEALMAGTPVIVSNTSGSSDFVASNLQGEIVRFGRPGEIAQALHERLRTSPVTDEARSILRNWANEAISPRAAAEYLWKTVTREKDVPTFPAPWTESI